jgi:hypothetical protein
MLSVEQVVNHAAKQLAQGAYIAPVQVARGTTVLGRTTLHRHRLAAGCTRFDIFAGHPVVGLRVALWKGDSLLDRTEAAEQATLFGCVEKPTEVEVAVESQGRPGEHLVQARREIQSPPLFLQHSVAAARLLGRLNDAGRVMLSSEIRGVQTLALEKDKRMILPLSIPPSTCKTVVVALEAGASGLELQAVNSLNHEVVDQGRGESLMSLRLCAKETPLEVELRVATEAGKARALIGIVEK